MPLDPRAAAALAIGQVLAGKSLNQALPPMLEQVAQRERSLLQQLCYGSLRHYPRTKALLLQLLAKPLRDKDLDIEGLLVAGLYQLDYTRIPTHAAVAATVGATRALKKDWARGLVNAVLRRYLRERDELTANLDSAAAASHPQWLYRKLEQQWPEDAATIVASNNCQPPMSLRLNTGVISREAYLEELSAAGIAATASPLSPQGVRLGEPQDVHGIPGFDAGRVSVQDEAAQLAALLLAAVPGDRVLDACAAPGGKACHILELQPLLAELVTMDVAGERLARVKENLERLGLTATMINADASAPPTRLTPASFDRILVDAPCSASGVIRRHPDVKVLRRQEDIAGFAQQQQKILTGLWPLLKPGGWLLYVTCSILDEENSSVIARFISRQSDAVALIPAGDWGVKLRHGRQLLPTKDGPDGLFYGLLRKKSPGTDEDSTTDTSLTGARSPV
jgi:16S rRNA (cytosine967-C5)-methyltransferase